MKTASSMNNQVAVVTLTEGGFGDRIAKRLAKESFFLAILDHKGTDGEKLAEAIRKEGGISFFKQADLSKQDDIKRCFEDIERFYGRVDILINAAELHNAPTPLAEVSPDEWNQIFALNLKGAFFSCREAIRVMRRQKSGQILNLSSTLGLDLPPCYGAYGISKLGLNALTELLAKEEGKYGIRVNAIAIGSVCVEDNAFHSQVNPDLEKAIVSHIPLKRHGTPEEVMETILFLISEEASYITGQIVNVSGGLQIPQLDPVLSS
jgi:3-oxoacyl-[acyl-carrier protein] reductase